MMSAWFFLQQTESNKILYILDDGNSFTGNYEQDNIYLECVAERFPTLPNKYNYMITRAKELFNPDIFIVWENDDWFFPWHIDSYLKAYVAYNADFVHADFVFSADYHGISKQYTRRTHYHGSLSYRASITSMPFYPETYKMAFDLMLIDRLNKNYRRCVPISKTPSYCWFHANPELPSGSLLPDRNLPNDNWYLTASRVRQEAEKHTFKPQLYQNYVTIINKLLPGSIDVERGVWNIEALAVGLDKIGGK